MTRRPQPTPRGASPPLSLLLRAWPSRRELGPHRARAVAWHDSGTLLCTQILQMCAGGLLLPRRSLQSQQAVGLQRELQGLSLATALRFPAARTSGPRDTW